MENVILVACQLPSQSDDHFESSLEELEALTKTAGGQVVAVVTQKRQKIDSATYIGSGKLQELEALEKELDVGTVIFNGELSPSQQGRLGALLYAKVLDRTQLILDIFAVRARSREGKLQVELAQLQYLLPRLSGMGESLSRLGGGIGTRGPGETKLESDRRYIRSRMKDISNQLKTVVQHRKRYRDRRMMNNQCQVVLVGYTNAGKSTLFNQLTAASTYAENQLFATLDPLTRKMNLLNGFICLLSDTVGFIQELPTQLVAAFRSTLEEVTGAQLIVHVLDASDPDLITHEKTVRALLEELGADELPMLTIYNKKDLLQTPFIVPKGSLLVSARDINDRDRILAEIESQIVQQMVPFHALLDADEGKLLNDIKLNTILNKQVYDENAQKYEVEGFVYPETAIASKLIHNQASTNKEL
ncbi:GTPase HflX [Sporolactobacillus nakayamae]|uniref:GTPase HflX n=1 Tax=Sporolactobacillus nakayamae TaxID=269670 RepID=A0A1I2N9N6_9BACL|nr:GTPase HflX [Sporolactobacillus nakayamae]SFF99599.1 GTP-binding protein HflX [Sporolactobacillus nakayamae]